MRVWWEGACWPPVRAAVTASRRSFLLLFPCIKRHLITQTSPDEKHSTAEMAADRSGTAQEDMHSSDLDLSPDHGCQISKRHARVTVKYNRKELQKRLDVEKWIDESLDQLYSGQVGPTAAQRLF